MIWQLAFILLLTIPILAIVLDSKVGKALAARIERRGLISEDDITPDRIKLLEGEVERLSEEVERLSDESQFLHKLLDDRPPGGGVLPPVDESR